MAQAGIYQIINTVNNKRYIGSAVNLKKRENEHFAHLRRGIHHSPYLQRSYVKHGRDAFVFETLITCHPTMCIFYEQQFLDQLKPEYNLSVEAGSRLGVPQPESMAKAQSERMKKRWAEMSPEKLRELRAKSTDGIKHYWRSRTIEERRVAAKHASDAALKVWEKLSDEDRAEQTAIRTQKFRASYSNMSPQEQIERNSKISSGKRAWWAALSEAEREQVKQNMRKPKGSK